MVVVDWSRNCGPQRKGGNIGLGKDDEIGLVVCGFSNQTDCLLYGLGGVEEDWGDIAS